MPWTVRIILLQATVRGAVGHGMEVWLSAPSTLIRRAEAKMMRRIFGCSRRPAAAALYWLTKTLPIDTMAQARSLKLAAKILDLGLEEGEPALELLALKELIKEFQKFKTMVLNSCECGSSDLEVQKYEEYWASRSSSQVQRNAAPTPTAVP